MKPENIEDLLQRTIQETWQISPEMLLYAREKFIFDYDSGEKEMVNISASLIIKHFYLNI